MAKKKDAQTDKNKDQIEQNEELQKCKSDIEDKTNEKKSKNDLDKDQEIQKLKDKIAELEDRLLRDMAEFENIKKRVQKEKEQAIAYAHERFARDLLAVVDALESGKSSIDSQEKPTQELLDQLIEGIDLTISQFKKVFEKHDISLVDIDGGFDPHFHEAVMKVDSKDHKSGEIVQVLQKGYKIKDRVLRPAMVSVAK